VSAEINSSAGVQARIDSMKKDIVTETSITGNSIDTQRRIEVGELAQQGGSRVFLTLVGGQEIIEENDTKTAQEIGELEGNAAIAKAEFTFAFVGLIGIGGAIRAVERLIGALIPNRASLGIARMGLMADQGTVEGIAVTTLTLFLFRRTGTRLIRSSWLIASILHRRTTHTGSRVVNHSIWTKEGSQPGFRAKKASFDDEIHGLGNEVIEALDGH
jgi:hypothetical protein